jgi:DNA-binding PadR family transcriptional regulator
MAVHDEAAYKMSNSVPYSELEYLILAMVGEGVTSGYAMRKEMNRMRGGRWSAESGSVYRVLRRLQKDGLLHEARKVGVPNRERTEYDLTPEGETLLNRWLTQPPDRGEMAFLVDPLRTRCYFLFRLKPQEQIRVVKAWLQENKLFLQDLQRDVDLIAATESWTPRVVAYQNLLHLGQARHEWLRKLLNSLRNQSGMPSAVAEDEMLAGV